MNIYIYIYIYIYICLYLYFQKNEKIHASSSKLFRPFEKSLLNALIYRMLEELLVSDIEFVRLVVFGHILIGDTWILYT
jgi:hypothetical protein